jgi:hypothetical protein
MVYNIYIYNCNLQFINDVIITKTRVHHPQADVIITLADFTPKYLKLVGFIKLALMDDFRGLNQPQ